MGNGLYVWLASLALKKILDEVTGFVKEKQMLIKLWAIKINES